MHKTSRISQNSPFSSIYITFPWDFKVCYICYSWQPLRLIFLYLFWSLYAVSLNISFCLEKNENLQTVTFVTHSLDVWTLSSGFGLKLLSYTPPGSNSSFILLLISVSVLPSVEVFLYHVPWKRQLFSQHHSAVTLPTTSFQWQIKILCWWNDTCLCVCVCVHVCSVRAIFWSGMLLILSLFQEHFAKGTRIGNLELLIHQHFLWEENGEPVQNRHGHRENINRNFTYTVTRAQDQNGELWSSSTTRCTTVPNWRQKMQWNSQNTIQKYDGKWIKKTVNWPLQTNCTIL